MTFVRSLYPPQKQGQLPNPLKSLGCQFEWGHFTTLKRSHAVSGVFFHGSYCSRPSPHLHPSCKPPSHLVPQVQSRINRETGTRTPSGSYNGADHLVHSCIERAIGGSRKFGLVVPWQLCNLTWRAGSLSGSICTISSHIRQPTGYTVGIY
jgi:hypothetical protein